MDLEITNGNGNIVNNNFCKTLEFQSLFSCLNTCACNSPVQLVLLMRRAGRSSSKLTWPFSSFIVNLVFSTESDSGYLLREGRGLKREKGGEKKNERKKKRNEIYAMSVAGSMQLIKQEVVNVKNSFK